MKQNGIEEEMEVEDENGDSSEKCCCWQFSVDTSLTAYWEKEMAVGLLGGEKDTQRAFNNLLVELAVKDKPYLYLRVN